MVGDAAVTPHPDTASGYVSGFRGYQELVTLYEALSHTTAPADQSAIYQSFNDRYEMHVSEKALEGTVTIITHNLRLMDTYVSDLGILAVRAATDELTKVFEVRSKVAVKLKAKWQKLQDDAAGIQSRYKKHSGTLKPLDWKTTVGTLWSDLAHCWKLQKILTSDHTLLVEKIALLESQTKTVDQMKQAFPT